MYKMPTLRSARIRSDENGITAHGITYARNTRYGSNLNKVGSASVGVMSSFRIAFRPSASHCSSPCGPTRLGPTRDWMRVTYHHAAEAELIETAQFHEHRLSDLGVEFLNAIDQALSL